MSTDARALAVVTCQLFRWRARLHTPLSRILIKWTCLSSPTNVTDEPLPGVFLPFMIYQLRAISLIFPRRGDSVLSLWSPVMAWGGWTFSRLAEEFQYQPPVADGAERGSFSTAYPFGSRGGLGSIPFSFRRGRSVGSRGSLIQGWKAVLRRSPTTGSSYGFRPLLLSSTTFRF